MKHDMWKNNVNATEKKIFTLVKISLSHFKSHILFTKKYLELLHLLARSKTPVLKPQEMQTMQKKTMIRTSIILSNLFFESQVGV